MRRTDEEFKAEVFDRSKKYVEKRKMSQRKVVFGCATFAVCIVVLVCLKPDIIMKDNVSNETNIGLENSNAIDGAQEIMPETINEYNINMTEDEVSAIEYKADYIRIDGSGDADEAFVKTETQGNNNKDELLLKKAETKEELDRFIEVLRDSDSVWDSIEEVASKYDEAFFDDNVLLLIYVGEGSGSIRHKVNEIQVEDGKLSVFIDRIVPEVGTCDMAGWLITVELDSSVTSGCTEFEAYKISENGRSGIL